MTRRFLLYALRWQLSTPILALVLSLLSTLNPWLAAAMANLLGSIIFFGVDRWIFKERR